MRNCRQILGTRVRDGCSLVLDDRGIAELEAVEVMSQSWEKTEEVHRRVA